MYPPIFNVKHFSIVSQNQNQSNHSNGRSEERKKSQQELKVKATKSPEARVDWLREWLDICGPIRERSKTKAIPAYFWYSIKSYSKAANHRPVGPIWGIPCFYQSVLSFLGYVKVRTSWDLYHKFQAHRKPSLIFFILNNPFSSLTSYRLFSLPFLTELILCNLIYLTIVLHVTKKKQK